MLPIAEIISDKLLFKSFIPIDKLELPSAIFHRIATAFYFHVISYHLMKDFQL